MKEVSSGYESSWECGLIWVSLNAGPREDEDGDDDDMDEIKGNEQSEEQEPDEDMTQMPSSPLGGKPSVGGRGRQ